MTDESLPDLLSIQAQAVVERAKSLGLIWNLRMATVDDGTVAAAVTATFDGDTVSMSMVSMAGTFVVGARVYVLIIPPAGNFIVGFA
jgi:hypothetical protein